MQFRAAILLSALMPHIHFHDLRQSCATLLFAQGVPMKEIQAWLGHSTIGTTANIYTHLDENSKINSANAIIGIWEQKTDTQSISSPSVRLKMVPPTGIEPVRFLGRGILSAKTHSERGGIRLHQSESISYTSSCIFLIFQSFFTQKLFVCLYFWEFFQNSLEHKFDAIFEPLEGCLEGCWHITL